MTDAEGPPGNNAHSLTARGGGSNAQVLVGVRAWRLPPSGPIPVMGARSQRRAASVAGVASGVAAGRPRRHALRSGPPCVALGIPPCGDHAPGRHTLGTTDPPSRPVPTRGGCTRRVWLNPAVRAIPPLRHRRPPCRDLPIGALPPARPTTKCGHHGGDPHRPPSARVARRSMLRLRLRRRARYSPSKPSAPSLPPRAAGRPLVPVSRRLSCCSPRLVCAWRCAASAFCPSPPPPPPSPYRTSTATRQLAAADGSPRACHPKERASPVPRPPGAIVSCSLVLRRRR